MAVISKFAGTVSQSTGGHFVSFSNLSNIRNSTSNSHAVSSILIQGKSENKNRPSTISCKNFGFNLPAGAEVQKIKVVYRYRKAVGSDYSSKHPKRVCNIPAPSISLLGVSGLSGKGVSATTSMTTSTKTFNVAGKVTRAQVNSSNFGCKLDWPTNTNKWNGYLRVSYVRVEVEYNLSQYGVSVKKVSGGFNGEDYTVELSISNVNRTSYNPSLTLSSPVGFTYKSCKGTGSLVQNSARSFTWNPKLGSNVGTSSINVVFTPSVTYPSGQSSYSGVFSLSESLNGASNSHTAVITEKPVTSDETAPDTPPSITNKDNTPILTEWHKVKLEEEIIPNLDVDSLHSHNVCFAFPVTSDGTVILNEEDTPILFGIDSSYDLTTYDSTKEVHIGTDLSKPYFEEGGLWFSSESTGLFVLFIYSSDDSRYPYWEDYIPQAGVYHRGFCNDTPDITYFFEVRPDEDDLTVPFFSILEPSEEELNRLGDGYPYVVQSDMKHTTSDSYERDWYKNNRIGVFNNPITDNITVTETTDPETGETTETVTDSTDYTSLTSQEIIENAEYWGNTLTDVNQYESIETQFTYDENYPLYIIITGDYPEAEDYNYTIGSVSFTSPCIIEKSVYKEREPSGNYPVPINSLILDTDSAELTIPTLNTSTPVVIYGLPLPDGYGNTDTMHIRGIMITGTIEQSDELVLSAKLTNHQGVSGTRTTVINDYDTTIDSANEFTLGGLGDLWGFTQAETTNLDDWELELTVSNLLNDTEANINLHNIQLTIYTETIQKQVINAQINDEDLSFYGAFIDNVTIPEGLKTDTNFLSIDGTDTNDAYRQNIREKEITLELSIGECDLPTSTVMLRQLTTLLVNDKDQYNRPIPKRVSFSHYPDVYWEYVMEDALDISQEAGAYSIKAKLTIPAGTSYSNETISTNITGFVQGVAAVNPVITIKPQAAEVTLTETVSKQAFHIGYSGNWQEGIVEINCEDRKAYLKTNEDDTNPIDISKYVDFNSDWFNLKGEYSFSGAGCVIRTVDYLERW